MTIFQRNKHNLSLFVGAGISLPSPSSLPLFGSLREAIASGLGVQSSQFMNLVAPEFLLSTLDRNGVPIAEILVDNLSSDEPNALHYALAEAAVAGIDVWTTNADELVEMAAARRGWGLPTSFGKNSSTTSDSIHLFKLHGTLTDPSSLAFKTEDVLAPLGSEVMARLRRSFHGRNVKICGYAGVDPDIQPALLSSLNYADSIEWFELPTGVQLLEARYQPLLAAGKLRIVPTSNPSQTLLQQLMRFGIGLDTPSMLIDALNDVTAVRPSVKRWNLRDSHFAAGQLFELIGKPNRGVVRYRIGARSGSLPNRFLCYRQLVSAGLYYKKPWARRARKLITLAARLPWFPGQQRVLSIHARLLEREGQYQACYLTAERAFAENCHAPERMLDVCAAARKVGRIKRTFALSEEAVRLLGRRAGAQGKWIARAFYERAYALRLGGKYPEALEAVERLSDIALYGGPSWRAWALCLRGCILCQATAEHDDAIEALLESRDLFLSLGELQKAAAVESNLCTAYRAADRLDDATERLNRAKTLWQRLSYQSVFENEVISFETAELHRQTGKVDRARSIYRLLGEHSRLPIHQILGHLGQAMLDDGDGFAQIEKSLTLARAIGFVPGVSYALCWLQVHGFKSREEARNEILDAGVFAPDMAGRLLQCDVPEQLPILFPS